MANIDNIVTGIEVQYGVQAIESEGLGLFYLQDDDREKIGIMTVNNGIPKWIIITKEQFKLLSDIMGSLKQGQAKALWKESKDIYDMIFN